MNLAHWECLRRCMGLRDRWRLGCPAGCCMMWALPWWATLLLPLVGAMQLNRQTMPWWWRLALMSCGWPKWLLAPPHGWRVELQALQAEERFEALHPVPAGCGSVARGARAGSLPGGWHPVACVLGRLYLGWLLPMSESDSHFHHNHWGSHHSRQTPGECCWNAVLVVLAAGTVQHCYHQ